jgi:predicted  nucleic acid-binding Zn-ribbon protein
MDRLAFYAIRLYNRDMSQTKNLYLLQQIDTEIDSSRVRLTEIEDQLNDNSALKQAKTKAEKAENSLHQAQIALKHAEQDVETQQTKITNNERALYGGAITNPKELEDLQMESAALKRHLATLEDRLLEAMVVFEEANKKSSAAQTELEDCRQQVAQENTELTAEQEDLNAKLEDLTGKKAEAEAPIDPAAMETYLQLRQSRAGVAVTEVVDNSCAACGANLTAAQAQAARSPSKITTCESCKRILYSR